MQKKDRKRKLQAFYKNFCKIGTKSSDNPSKTPRLNVTEKDQKFIFVKNK